jgi:hypothetical protein
MPEIKSLTDGSISIIELLNDIKEGKICIGKPHFQRGLVWNTDLKTNLIESLMLDIPIGTFMLWENNSIEYGTPLHESDKFEYLIIDGQQRLNTLWKFYNDIQKDIETDNEYENESHWYINKRTIEEGKDFIKHIRIAGNTKDKDKLIPLNCFFSKGNNSQKKYEKDSDNELARKRENNFGFDVFLKILLQNFYYYFAFDPQKDKGFDFDRVDDLIENYDKLENKDDFIKIYNQSKIIIEFLAGGKNGDVF